MNNWSISRKLLCLVAIAIITFVGMALYGISNTRSTFEWVKAVDATAQDFQRSSKEISDPVHRVRESALSIVLAPDSEAREMLNSAQKEKSREIDEAFRGWQSDRGTTPERIEFEKLQAEWERYKKLKDFTIDRAINGFREEAFINAVGAGRAQFDAVIAQLDTWQKAKIDECSRSVPRGRCAL